MKLGRPSSVKHALLNSLYKLSYLKRLCFSNIEYKSPVQYTQIQLCTLIKKNTYMMLVQHMF